MFAGACSGAPVLIMTGMAAISGFSALWARNSRPSITGIFKSSRMTAGGAEFSKSSRASRAFRGEPTRPQYYCKHVEYILIVVDQENRALFLGKHDYIVAKGQLRC